MSELYTSSEIDTPRSKDLAIISIQTDFDVEARELYEWSQFL